MPQKTTRARGAVLPQPLCTPVQMAYAPSLAKRAAALEAVAAHFLLPRSYLVCDKHFSVDSRRKNMKYTRGITRNKASTGCFTLIFCHCFPISFARRALIRIELLVLAGGSQGLHRMDLLA